MLVHACMRGQMRTWNAPFYHSLPYSLETGSISELGIWAWGLHWWPACPGDPAVSGSLLVASPWSSPRMAFRSSCLRYQTLTHWTIVPALSMDDFWGRFNTISGRIWLSENGRCNCHNYILKRKGSDQQRGPPYPWSVRDHVWLHRSCPLQLRKSIGPFEMNTQCCSWFLR